MAEFLINLNIVPKITGGSAIFKEIEQAANSSLSSITQKLQQGLAAAKTPEERQTVAAQAGLELRQLQIAPERARIEQIRAGDFKAGSAADENAKKALNKVFSAENEHFSQLERLIREHDPRGEIVGIAQSGPGSARVRARYAAGNLESIPYGTPGLVGPTKDAKGVTAGQQIIGAENAQVAAETRASIAKMLAANDDYIVNVALAAAGFQAIRAQVQALLAIDGSYIRNRTQQVGADREILAAVAQARAANDEYAKTEARLTSSTQALKGERDRILADEVAYQDALEKSARAKDKQAAEQSGRRADDPGRLDDIATKRVADERARAEVEGRLVGNVVATESAVKKTLAQEQQRADKAAAMNRLSDEELNQLVRRRIEEDKLNKDLQRRTVQAELAAAKERGVTPTRFQSFTASTKGEGANPLEQATFGAALGQRALTAGQFAFAGLSLRQTLTTVTGMVNEAEKLELVFKQIKLQLGAIGLSDSFEKVRSDVLGMAKDLGLGADQLAVIEQRAIGVYQNIEQASQATRAVGQLQVVSGVPAEEIFKNLQPAALAFDTTIGAIGDKVIGLSQRMGVSIKETIDFFGRAAEVASSTGVTLDQLAAIAGTLQQRISVGGTAAADLFDRVATAAGQNMDKILQLANRIPELAPQMQQLTTDFAVGDTGPALLIIAQNWDKLGSSAQSSLLKVIANRREMATFKALLDNLGPALAKEGANIDDNGKLSLANSQAQDTLAQSIARLKEGLRQLGDGIARSGIGDLFKDIFKLGGDVASVATVILHVFDALNGATFGLAGRLLTLVLAIKAYSVAMAVATKVRAGSLLTGLFGPPGAGGAAAEAESVGLAARASALRTAGAYAAGRAVAGSTKPTRFILGKIPGGAGTAAEEAASVAPELTGLAGLGAVAGSAGGLLAIGAAALAVQAAYSKVKSDAAKQGQKFLDRATELLKTGTDAQKATIDAIAKSNLSVTETLASNLGIDVPKTEAEKAEIAVNQAGQIAALKALQADKSLSGSLGTETTKKTWFGLQGFGKNRQITLQGLIDRIQNGDAQAIVESKDLLAHLKLDPTKKAEVEAAINVASATAKAAGGALIDTAEQVVADFKAGRASSADAIASIKSQLAQEHTILDAQIKAGVDTTTTKKEIDTLTADSAGVIATITQNAQQWIALVTAMGGNTAQIQTATQTEINKLETALQTAELSPADAAKTLADIVALKQQSLKNVADHMADANSALAAINKGVTISTADLNAAGIFPQIPVTAGGTTGPAPKLTVPEDAWGPPGAKPAAAGPQFSDPPDGFPWLDPNTGITFTWSTADHGWRVPPQAVDQAAAQKRKTQDDQAPYTLAASQTRDPLKQAQTALDASKKHQADVQGQTGLAKATTAELQQAQADVNEKQKALDDANNAIATASIDLARAQFGLGQNVLEDAKVLQKKADQAVATAKGQGAIAESQAKILELQAAQAKIDAVFQRSQAAVDLVIAVDNFNGDTVGAAREGLKKLQAQLANEVAKKSGSEVTDPIRAQIKTQQKAIIDAQISDQEDLVNFQLEMNQITTGQAISVYRSMLGIAANDKDRRAILLKIKALEKGSSGDLQFNIGDIQIPTLYEVRRTRQSSALGIGYNDNRQVSVTFHNYNATDYQGAVDSFAELWNQPSRYGIAPSSYPTRN